ncbi:hypothetical protein [Paeniclostridium hominis]|uniref:hypothetical protein n=1 Tax=Paeniclostridium hominis TaxID=2764329 RepID=UPI0022E1B228|nr:hypothetical protein [Paeniclostridium hominis]
MSKEKLTEIVLKEGTFTIDEIVDMTGKARSTVKDKPGTILKQLNYHCIATREGTGEDIVYILSNVPSEPIPKKRFGKDPNKTRKGRDDKGLSRDSYNTIKEQFKPLIYNVLLTKPNFVHTATFSNWLKQTGLVKEEFIKERDRVQDECFYSDFTKDFITVESDSLRRCFISALDSMSKSKQGKVSWYKKKIAINLDGEHIELGERETAEIDNIEQELYNLFGVTSRNELMYKSRKELREFDVMIREILIDRYKYSACYTAYQVIAKLGVKEETINKNLEEAKKKYGLTDNIQKALTTCKDLIYDSRFKRAEDRFSKRAAKREIEINAKYDEQLIDNWGDDDFVEFLREIELNDCYSLESYIEQWINHYKKYIHNKK